MSFMDQVNVRSNRNELYHVYKYGNLSIILNET